ncbi:hypothetical protein Tco_0983171 [Tanacetum coccineum]
MGQVCFHKFRPDTELLLEIIWGSTQAEHPEGNSLSDCSLSDLVMLKIEVIVEARTVARDVVEARARDMVEAGDERVTHLIMLDDILEPA